MPGSFGAAPNDDGMFASTTSRLKNGAVALNTDTVEVPTGTPGAPGNGVLGVTTVPNASGVFGGNNSSDHRGVGVSGRSDHGTGVAGFSNQGDAVLGQGGIGGNAIHGRGGTFAGFFEGGVHIQGGSCEIRKIGAIGGELSIDGPFFSPSKHFLIDHPLDPSNQSLCHASIESDCMLTVYRGRAMTDEKGDATVVLPAYVAALNIGFEYQLTVIGRLAHAVIWREIEGNTFLIRSDEPGVTVSWQVSGVRNDVYARNNPMIVERQKQPGEAAPKPVERSPRAVVSLPTNGGEAPDFIAA